MTQKQFFAQLDSTLAGFGYKSNIFDERANQPGDASFLNDLTSLHAVLQDVFVYNLNVYQSHFRQADKLDKRAFQEKQQMTKTAEKLETLEAKNASEGHLSAARGQLFSAQDRLDSILAEKASVFADAQAYFPTFMRARMAEEAARMAAHAYRTGDYVKAQERLSQADHLLPKFGV